MTFANAHLSQLQQLRKFAQSCLLWSNSAADVASTGLIK